MESSAGYPDSPMDQDEAAFPCKGCGEVCQKKMDGPQTELEPCLPLIHAPPKREMVHWLIVFVQILEEGKAFELGKSLSTDYGRIVARPIF